MAFCGYVFFEWSVVDAKQSKSVPNADGTLGVEAFRSVPPGCAGRSNFWTLGRPDVDVDDGLREIGPVHSLSRCVSS